ncbi:MAG: bifunctional phosphopantothenoylcysteine decarboxylase/phosphopantothenate--cysteine ligase CoaBC [Candidatus Binatia bacterium]|nr:bifunctional phosphopantothenoylcysteine decarboxylase/phosphopantothenate--cysteine ligase CoaBC [Candidatus Binatia bacterium]MDG1958697.1 bifunctional phosphopantothenoylcysteine decarboxylase/phosphopantothenate--cysteine ligase CoaBC [Candidatus Binatia bacterium]MDG2008994.1 bifunctional phosphopantothenoylcysteine decarboxylase/phosphopantothenate--cysteine ligase CoaBC [Candidatus Binatia bacterium]
MLNGSTVILAVGGGIAAYKAPELVRRLRDEGARVRVLLTRNAQQFVSRLTLQTLSGEPVATDLFDLTQESEIGHIDLADSADAILVAPATANVIGKLANGIADDLLTTVLLATRAPVVLAPAMNVHMYENEVVQANLENLRRRNCKVIPPDNGALACGYEGPGRQPDPPVLLEALAGALGRRDLEAESVLITAGPTREPLDPVRYLSNRSSGKMGYALARAALRRGAHVSLVAGPTGLETPAGVEFHRVETAAEMAARVEALCETATIVIAAAAVADYAPSDIAAQKAAKAAGGLSLELVGTQDIVADVVPRRASLYVVGFAAETQDVLARAAKKRERKKLDMIVANDVARAGAGFDVDTNIVTILDRAGSLELPMLSKDEVADRILNRIRENQSSRD